MACLYKGCLCQVPDARPCHCRNTSWLYIKFKNYFFALLKVKWPFLFNKVLKLLNNIKDFPRASKGNMTDSKEFRLLSKSFNLCNITEISLDINNCLNFSDKSRQNVFHNIISAGVGILETFKRILLFTASVLSKTSLGTNLGGESHQWFKNQKI